MLEICLNCDTCDFYDGRDEEKNSSEPLITLIKMIKKKSLSPERALLISDGR